ncbi:MAG: hypothetical protein AAGD00_06670 [Planctomycetota bacterium]
MNPVERMLGKGVDARDPLSLLGLTGARADDAAIDPALRARLAEVAAHPEASTPSADEVRLALHVAAAQLREQSQRTAANTAERSDWQRSDRLIVGLLVHSGGWNHEARRRIASIAAARGLTQEDIVRAIAHAGRSRAALTPSRVGGDPSAAPLEERTPNRTPAAATTGPVRTILLFGSALMALAAAAMLLVLGQIDLSPHNASGPSAKVTTTPGADLAASEVFQISPQSSGLSSNESGESRTFTELIDTARAIAERDPLSVGGATLAALEAAADQWHTWTPEQIDAAAGAAVAQLIEVASSPGGAGVLRSLLDDLPPALEIASLDITHVLWTSALLERARAELPSPWPARIAQRRAATFRSAGALASNDRRGIWDGLFDAVESSGRMLVLQGTNVSTWDAWADAMVCVARRDAVLAQRVRLRLLDDWIRAPAFESTSPESRAALETLLTPVEFEPASEPAERLIAWFDDAAVSSEALHAITTHLVVRSVIEDADFAWVLDPSADGRARVSRRDLFAEALRLPQRGDRGTGISRWARLAASELRDQRNMTPTGSIEVLAQRTLFTEAAALYWAGEVERSQDLLDEFESDSIRGTSTRDEDPSDPASALTRPGLRPDGEWAARYLNAGRDIAHRIDLLNELADAQDQPGPVDADVLVRAALLATPPEVRRAAARTAETFADTPSVIYALLEDLENAPRVRESTRLIEAITGTRLPDARDEAWAIEARRALLAQTIGALADPRLARADAAAVRIAESLESQRAALDANASGGTASDTELDPSDAARRLTEHWLQRAWRSAGEDDVLGSTRSLVSRRAARRAVARGPLQVFAAEYTSLAETIALVVLAEQPTRQGEVRDAYVSYERARATAPDAPAQCGAAQALIIRLWALRLDATLVLEGDDA